MAWAVGAIHFGRTIEAIEPELGALGRSGIVLPHPLHKLAIRLELAEAMAKSTVLHSLIGCRATAGDVLVHNTPAREATFDSDRAIAMRLYQALEQPVA